MGGLVSALVTLEGHPPQEIIVQSTAQGPNYRQDMHLFLSVDGGASYKDVRRCVCVRVPPPCARPTGACGCNLPCAHQILCMQISVTHVLK